jgi:EAL domain-containing protein (putative c-di-GMP-specific phosphodiesterase class I)
VARVGVDQFLVLLPDCDVEDSLLLGEELVRCMQEQIRADSIPIRLTARCGVAAFPAHGRTAEELMRRADVALFSAHKNAASLAMFEPSAEQRHRRQVQVLGELQRGIEADQLCVVYQPKIDLRTHAMHGCEALVRWRHPAHGEIPPGEFVPYAERTGSIRHLTSWVLGAVISQLAHWNAAGRTMEVAVNLSAADIADPGLATEIEALLARHGVHGRQLVCEITEGVAMRDVEVALRGMSRLRGLGMRFAIDDFGTGYSSLAQLSRLPVDELKLDGGLIAQLADERSRMIVRAMIELGHALDLRIVAEGVENVQLMRAASRLGCDIAQGYLYSKPLSADELLSWMSTRHVPELAAHEGTLAFTARVRNLSL